MKNKKLIPIVLLSTLMLTACSNDVVAKPSDYDNPLVVNTGSDKLSSDVANNITSIIYDAMTTEHSQKMFSMKSYYKSLIPFMVIMKH